MPEERAHGHCLPPRNLLRQNSSTSDLLPSSSPHKESGHNRNHCLSWRSWRRRHRMSCQMTSYQKQGIQPGFLKGRTTLMQELPITVHSNPQWKNSLYIKLKFIISPLTMKDIDTTTIIDSGAQVNCIDWAFVWWHHIPMTPLKTPFLIQNTDQTSNIICQYETSVFVQIGTVTQKICFFVMNGGKENCYGRRTTHFIFSLFSCRLYYAKSFLF